MQIDLNILKRFYDTIYKPNIVEEQTSYLLALAARHKYAREEGNIIKLGHKSEMMNREAVDRDDFALFVSKLHRLMGDDYAYIDDVGQPIPERMKVLYVAVNAADTLSAYSIFTRKLTERNIELINGRGKKLTPYSIPQLWWTSLQVEMNRKLWLDYDLDLKDREMRFGAEDAVSKFMDRDFPEIEYHTVVTQGGIHLLVSNAKGSFDKDVNPMTIGKELQKGFNYLCTEIKRNENNLIPCPGTMQKDHKVTFR